MAADIWPPQRFPPFAFVLRHGTADAELPGTPTRRRRLRIKPGRRSQPVTTGERGSGFLSGAVLAARLAGLGGPCGSGRVIPRCRMFFPVSPQQNSLAAASIGCVGPVFWESGTRSRSYSDQRDLTWCSGRFWCTKENVEVGSRTLRLPGIWDEAWLSDWILGMLRDLSESGITQVTRPGHKPSGHISFLVTKRIPGYFSVFFRRLSVISISGASERNAELNNIDHVAGTRILPGNIDPDIYADPT